MSVMVDFKSVYLEIWKHLRDARVYKRMLAMAMAGLLAGCSTIRYGGAPEPSFDVDKDLKQLAEKFEPTASISDFYTKNTKEARDEFITGRITMMNIRYIQFIRNLTSEKQLLDTAVAMLTLGLNLAGASFAAASTKTVLAAISAGVVGSKEAIDKNYFFDKTIPALVAQMNAERKKALYPLLFGLKQKTLDDYSFAQAVTDLNDYYLAGTFTGAIHGIQVDAAVKEKAADDKIATLSNIPLVRVIQMQEVTLSILKLRKSDLPKIRKAINALKDAKIKEQVDVRINKTKGTYDSELLDVPDKADQEFKKDMQDDKQFRSAINELQAYVAAAEGESQFDAVIKAFTDLFSK